MLGLFFIIAAVISVLIFFVNRRGLTQVLVPLFLACELALAGYAFLHKGASDTLYYSFDSLGVLLMLVLTLLSLATFYHSFLYMRRHQFTSRQESIYFASLVMMITAMTSAYFAENIALMWVSVETTTLFVSLLIFHDRSREAIEASWKYLFISSVGVALAFMGILFLSIVASKGGLSDLSLRNLLSIAETMDTRWLKIAFLLVVTGFSAKMGLFPLHTVAVDAHTVAPPPISAFISTTLMNVGFVGIFRVFTIVAQTEILAWAQHVLLIAGLLSVAMSAVQLLRVAHAKRMFAFSSLEHMGLVAIGLAIGGVGYYAALLQIVFHSFVKSSLFYQISQVHSVYKSYNIRDISGYFRIHPAGALALLFGFVSITAMPPSGLFISELYLLIGLFTGAWVIVAVLVLLLLTVIIFVFARHTFSMLFGAVPDHIDPSVLRMNRYESLSQYILLGLVVYLGVAPPAFFTELIRQILTVLS